jgi:acyl-CoA thioesterase
MKVSRSPGGAARYAASVSGDWNAPVYPSGGVVTAVALRAIEAELAQPHQTLRTFTTTFVSTVEAGEIEIDVERLRVGKRMSQLRADARSKGAGEPGHLTIAAFGERRDGFEFQYAAAPEVGPPEDYPGVATPPPGTPAFRAPFFENVETKRVRMFHSFESGWEGGRAEAIRWIRYRVAPRLDDGRIDPLSLVALADTMPSAIAQYMGPGYPFFHAPSVDLSMRFLDDTDDEWCLIRTVAHWAADGYASAEATLWDAHRRLIAHATQLVLLRFPDPQDLARR